MTSVHALLRGSWLPGPAGRRPRTDDGRSLLAAAAVAVALAVAAAGATLLGRRLAGGFAAVPTAAVPWAIAATGIPLVFVVQAAARLGGERWPDWLARLGLAAGAVAVAPLVAPPAWPGRILGLAGTAVTLLVALRPAGGWRASRLAGLRPSRRRQEPQPWVTERRGLAAEPEVAAVAGRSAAAGVEQPLGSAWVAPPGGFRQRLERYETAAGEDCIRGEVMLPIAAGSRTGHAHVGFCPSFATLPAVEVITDCDFVEAEVTAAEVLPWGVRVECRLSEPAEEPLAIPVAIRATRPA